MDVDSKAPVWKFTDWSDEMSSIVTNGKTSIKALEREEPPLPRRQEPVETAVVPVQQISAVVGPSESNSTESRLESEEKTMYSVVEARTTSLEKWDTRMEMCLICNSSAAHVCLDEQGEMTYSDQYALICHDCGECYHTYCLSPPVTDKSMIKPSVEKWRCPHCKFCIICNQAHNESQLVVCDRCDRCFHSYCANLTPTEVEGDEWFCRDCSVCANCQTPFTSSPASLPPQRRYALCTPCNQLYDSRIQPLADRIRGLISLETSDGSTTSVAANPSSLPPTKRPFQPSSDTSTSSTPPLPAKSTASASSKPKNGTKTQVEKKPKVTKQSSSSTPAAPAPAKAPLPAINMPSTLSMMVPQASPPLHQTAARPTNQPPTIPPPHFTWDSQREPVRFSEEPHLQHHSLPSSNRSISSQGLPIAQQGMDRMDPNLSWNFPNANFSPMNPSLQQGFLHQNHQHHHSMGSQHGPTTPRGSQFQGARMAAPYDMQPPIQPPYNKQSFSAMPQQVEPTSFPAMEADQRNYGGFHSSSAPYFQPRQQPHELQQHMMPPQMQQIQLQQSPRWNGMPQQQQLGQAPVLQPMGQLPSPPPVNGRVLDLAHHPSLPFLISADVIVVAVGSGGGGNFPSLQGDWRQIFELSSASYQAICNFFRGLEALYSHCPAFFIPAGQFPILEDCPNSEFIMNVLLHGATPTTIPPYVLPTGTSVPAGTLLLPPREIVQRSQASPQQARTPQQGHQLQPQQQQQQQPFAALPSPRGTMLPAFFPGTSAALANPSLPQFTPARPAQAVAPSPSAATAYAGGSLTPRSLPPTTTPLGHATATGAAPIAGPSAPHPPLPPTSHALNMHHQASLPLPGAQNPLPLSGLPPMGQTFSAGAVSAVPSSQAAKDASHQSRPVPSTLPPGLPNFSPFQSTFPIVSESAPMGPASTAPAAAVAGAKATSAAKKAASSNKERKPAVHNKTPAAHPPPSAASMQGVMLITEPTKELLASSSASGSPAPFVSLAGEKSSSSVTELGPATPSTSTASTSSSVTPAAPKREKRKREQLSSYAKDLQAKLKVLLYGPAYLFILRAEDWNPMADSVLAKIRTEVVYPFVGYVEPEFPKPKRRAPVTMTNYSMFDVRQATMTMIPTTPLYSDKGRNCVFCSTPGDHPVLGRLLPLQLADSWVHSGCAVWSSDVRESEDGELRQLYHAIRKSKTTSCAKCHQHGASVACPVARCSRRYHLSCAIQSPCRFIKENGAVPRYMICPEHATKFESVVWTGRLLDEGAIGVEAHSSVGIGEYDLSDFDTHRKLHISETDLRQRIAKKEANLDLQTWTSYAFRSGALIVAHIGSINTRQSFHTKDNIFTTGYRAFRRYWSWKPAPIQPSVAELRHLVCNPFTAYPPRATYEISISEVDSRILFTIVASDDPLNPIETNDMASAWNEVVSRVNASRAQWGSRCTPESHSPYSPSFSSSKTEGADDSAQSSNLNHSTTHASQLANSTDNSLTLPGSGEHSSSSMMANPSQQPQQQECGQILVNIPTGFFFGYESPHLTSHMERLPGAMQLHHYRRKHDMVIRLPAVLTLAVTRYWDPEKNPVILDAPANESGAARCQPYVRLSSYERFKQVDAFPCHPAAGLMSFKDLARTRAKFGQMLYPQADNSIRGAINVHNMNSYSILTRFRLMKASENIRLKVLRSKIQGRGLFVMEDVCDGEFLIEYVGEVISHRLADEREKRYNSRGIGCYMFSVSNDFVIDATEKGNHSRFINHSCEPNCQIQIEKIDGSPRIVIFAKHAIRQGEELTYDYCFEPEEEKLPCHCGTPSCRGFMN